MKNRMVLGMLLVGLTALTTVSCSGATPTPTPTPTAAPADVQVQDAYGARDAVIEYLQEKYPDLFPAGTLVWQEQEITPTGLVGASTVRFTSGDWEITVSYPIVLPANTVYTVTVVDTAQGLDWEGTVAADGTITETDALEPTDEEAARDTAEAFVRNSPTFLFDGIEDTLKLIDTQSADGAWVFTFQFDSRHAGYGDRTGQVLAQVITPHDASITIKDGDVTSAIMDEQWDMLAQQMMDEDDNPGPTVPPVDDGTTSEQVTFSYDELLAQKHIAAEVTVNLPGSLIVALGSNPSTGFQWADAEIGDAAVLAECSRQFMEPQGGLVGAPGQDVWTFTTLEKGVSTLQFQYSRPWEGGEQDEWTVDLTVTVN